MKIAHLCLPRLLASRQGPEKNGSWGKKDGLRWAGCGIDARPSCYWVSADHGGLGLWLAVVAGVLLLARRCCQRAWELGLGVGPQGELEAGAISGCPPPHPESAQPPRLLQLGILSQQLRQDAHWMILRRGGLGGTWPLTGWGVVCLAHLWGGSGQPGPPALLSGTVGTSWPHIPIHPYSTGRTGEMGTWRTPQEEPETTGASGGQNIQEVSPMFFHTWGRLEWIPDLNHIFSWWRQCSLENYWRQSQPNRTADPYHGEVRRGQKSLGVRRAPRPYQWPCQAEDGDSTPGSVGPPSKLG